MTPTSKWTVQYSYPFGLPTCKREERWYEHNGRPFVVKRYRNDSGRITHYCALTDCLERNFENGYFARSLKVMLERCENYINASARV